MKTSIKELENLLEAFKGNNQNLTKLLQKNPRLSLIVRLNSGMSLKELAKKIKTTPETLSQNERGKTKKMSKLLAEKLTQLSANSDRLNEQKVKETFLKFKELSNGGQKQALLRAEKSEATEQEKKLIDVLTKFKIPFNKGRTITTSIGPVNVDFELDIKNNPIFIETTIDMENKKMESMGLRAIKIKQVINNAKMVAVIPNSSSENKIKRLEDFDLIIKESEFEKFVNGLLAP